MENKNFSTGKRGGGTFSGRKIRGGFMKHICDLLLCLVLSASVWAGDVLPWGQGDGQMISSVPEEFASVLWWRAGGFAAAVQYLEMDWPGDDGREQRVSVTSLSEIQDELAQAIEAGEQPPAFDLSGVPEQEGVPLAVKNLYYRILSNNPRYKYAYDFNAEVDPDGLLRCTVSYMPYRTGDYPDGFCSVEVDSLRSLIKVARDGLGQENIPIRITNLSLTVDDMNKALQQVGGGYLFCQLNRDGTAITVVPQGGLTLGEARARLAEIDGLAEQVFLETVAAGMSQAEQAEALYTYLTQNVDYDFRYYSHPGEMPYESTTAYGALHNNLAICGGDAQAFQTLLEKAGIPCITVSGKAGGENHMWNMARIDGRWLYYDPTGDRGRADYGFLYCGVEGEALDRHTWDADWFNRLSEALFSL